MYLGDGRGCVGLAAALLRQSTSLGRNFGLTGKMHADSFPHANLLVVCGYYNAASAWFAGIDCFGTLNIHAPLASYAPGLVIGRLVTGRPEITNWTPVASSLDVAYDVDVYVTYDTDRPTIMLDVPGLGSLDYRVASGSFSDRRVGIGTYGGLVTATRFYRELPV